MKYIFITLFVSLHLISCNNKKSEEEVKAAEEMSSIGQNELGAHQQELISIEQTIVTQEKRIKDLKEGKYHISEDEVKFEISYAEQLIRDLKIKQEDSKSQIARIRKELDSLDLVLKK